MVYLVSEMPVGAKKIKENSSSPDLRIWAFRVVSKYRREPSVGLLDKFKNQDRNGELYVIAGLGNPGRQYEQTKHNVGFHVIDKLADKYDIKVEKF